MRRLVAVSMLVVGATFGPTTTLGSLQDDPERQYEPVAVTVKPREIHRKTAIQVSFVAPYDLPPGHQWAANLSTCAKVKGKRFQEFTRKTQYTEDVPLVGGATAGSKAQGTLRRRDMTPRSKGKEAWCVGKALLLIIEHNPNDDSANDIEFLALKGGVRSPGGAEPSKPLFKVIPISR